LAGELRRPGLLRILVEQHMRVRVERHGRPRVSELGGKPFTPRRFIERCCEPCLRAEEDWSWPPKRTKGEAKACVSCGTTLEAGGIRGRSGLVCTRSLAGCWQALACP
jgi:hypothetical protein